MEKYEKYQLILSEKMLNNNKNGALENNQN